ncbi:MAG TPA: hypothetical protein ACFYEF_11980, partial [Candidatus Wunengus sp. YC63]|uniref:hypothetical protein n=1 Tax=Candidatus Wunengus sp. YC64 TaxID=3367700 RepID=UPI00402748FD
MKSGTEKFTKNINGGKVVIARVLSEAIPSPWDCFVVPSRNDKRVATHKGMRSLPAILAPSFHDILV